MGNVRPYDPTPPPVDKVDLSSYPLKLAKLSLNNKAKGIKKYVIELSNEDRGLHLENPLFAPQWRSLIQDFDKKLPWIVFKHIFQFQGHKKQLDLILFGDPWSRADLYQMGI